MTIVERLTKPVIPRQLLRSTFSVDVADRIRAGSTVREALSEILQGISDGSGPRTSDVLLDLEEMGVWHPRPEE